MTNRLKIILRFGIYSAMFIVAGFGFGDWQYYAIAVILILLSVVENFKDKK